MTLILSGTDGVSDIDGTAAAPAIRGTDANTGIFFPAADTIAFAEGGAEAMRIDSSGQVGIGTSSPTGKLDVATGTGANFRVLFSTTNQVEVSNYSTASGYRETLFAGSLLTFYTGTAGGSSTTERMRIDSSGNVGINTTSPASKLDISTGGSTGTTDMITLSGLDSGSAKQTYGVIRMGIENNTASSEQGNIVLQTVESGTVRDRININGSGYISFINGGTERARITSDGVFAVGKTSTDSNTVGASMRTDGYCTMVRSADKCLDVNRKTNDGTLVSFQQDGTEEGSISVSGNTVSYNAFAGGHWTQLPEGRGYNPEILRGTVMSSIGEMCEWKSVEWTETIEHPAVPAVDAKDAVLDEEGNVIEPAVEAVEGKDAWTETIPHREAYLGNLAVGATFTEDGVTKTVVDDGNERLPKVKISDVVGDKAVYGVFQTWDEVQDMLVTSLGAFVVRIAAGVTVQIGDLLESNGDGCAKVQDDDVIRSKTIGKVTSTTPSATYADGSYTVPAVLYCG